MTDTKKKIIVERLITCFDRSIRHEKEVIFESESYEYYKKYLIDRFDSGAAKNLQYYNKIYSYRLIEHEGTDEEYREKVLRKSDPEKMIAVEANDVILGVFLDTPEGIEAIEREIHNHPEDFESCGYDEDEDEEFEAPSRDSIISFLDDLHEVYDYKIAYIKPYTKYVFDEY